MVYRMEWQNDLMSGFFTVPGSLSVFPFTREVPTSGVISLSWLDAQKSFQSAALPVHLGRDQQAEFVVNDPRVSRLHAKLSWREGKFYLEDVSSYGTWVRFAGSSAIVALRRQECVLLVEGEIALGAPFDDFTVPSISFTMPAPAASRIGHPG